MPSAGDTDPVDASPLRHRLDGFDRPVSGNPRPETNGNRLSPRNRQCYRLRHDAANGAGRLADGATFAKEQPVSDPTTFVCGCCALRLFAAPGRGLHLLYRSATNTTLRDMYSLVSRDQGRTFQSRRIHEWQIGACPMTSMTLAASRTPLGQRLADRCSGVELRDSRFTLRRGLHDPVLSSLSSNSSDSSAWPAARG
jgi:hypothetical protein